MKALLLTIGTIGTLLFVTFIIFFINLHRYYQQEQRRYYDQAILEIVKSEQEICRLIDLRLKDAEHDSSLEFMIDNKKYTVWVEE